MKFEEIIKKISAALAATVMFIIAAGMYLSAKGFIMDESGSIYLGQTAQAKSNVEEIAGNTHLNLPKNFVLGKPTAAVTVYEYSSLGCYHCADFHTETLPRLKKDYIDTGKVKLIFADFPLDKKSLRASALARCMPNSPKYYDFLSLLFKKQGEWSRSNKSDQIFVEYASLNGLPAERAKKCLDDEKVIDELMYIRQQGMETLGIKGTPSLLIVADDEREILHGAPDYDELKEILNKALGINN